MNKKKSNKLIMVSIVEPLSTPSTDPTAHLCDEQKQNPTIPSDYDLLNFPGIVLTENTVPWINKFLHTVIDNTLTDIIFFQEGSDHKQINIAMGSMLDKKHLEFPTNLRLHKAFSLFPLSDPTYFSGLVYLKKRLFLFFIGSKGAEVIFYITPKIFMNKVSCRFHMSNCNPINYAQKIIDNQLSYIASHKTGKLDYGIFPEKNNTALSLTILFDVSSFKQTLAFFKCFYIANPNATKLHEVKQKGQISSLAIPDKLRASFSHQLALFLECIGALKYIDIPAAQAILLKTTPDYFDDRAEKFRNDIGLIYFNYQKKGKGLTITVSLIIKKNKRPSFLKKLNSFFSNSLVKNKFVSWKTCKVVRTRKRKTKQEKCAQAVAIQITFDKKQPQKKPDLKLLNKSIKILLSFFSKEQRKFFADKKAEKENNPMPSTLFQLSNNDNEETRIIGRGSFQPFQDTNVKISFRKQPTRVYNNSA